jgi:GAF domain-containing protein
MDLRPDIGDALLQVTREINEPRELQSTLDMIVETAARSLPGINHVGITIASRDGGMETRAGSDPFVWELDELQYELGEGPCVHAIGVDPVTTVEWASREQRWPRFMKLAVAKGLRSQVGMRLYTERETLGGLNMYSTTTDTIDADVVHLAELFAAHAALALGHSRREEQLTTALRTRKIIGQAIGILMERHAVDEDGAFAYLTRVSSHSNVKLRRVAQEIVDLRNDASRDAENPTSAAFLGALAANKAPSGCTPRIARTEPFKRS